MKIMMSVGIALIISGTFLLLYGYWRVVSFTSVGGELAFMGELGNLWRSMLFAGVGILSVIIGVILADDSHEGG